MMQCRLDEHIRSNGVKTGKKRKPPAPHSRAIHQTVSRFELWLVAFVLSAGMLAYEILLTRVASVLLTSDHLFLVLALALLGLALGSIVEYFLALRPLRVDVLSPGFWLTGNAFVMVVAIVALIKLGPGGGLPVLVAVVAMIAGYQVSLAVGVACYMLAAFCANRITSISPQQPGLERTVP